MDETNVFEGGTDGSSIMAEHRGCTAPLPTDSEEEKDHGQDEIDEAIHGEEVDSELSTILEPRCRVKVPSGTGVHHEDGPDNRLQYEEKPESPWRPRQIYSGELFRARPTDMYTTTAPLRSKGMSTVKIGILGSDLEADEALMEEISDGEEAEERNMAYGGIAWESEEEEHSLLRGFPLMLHAARIGDMAMFDSAIREMRAKHSQQQVQEILAERDPDGRSLLAVAARSGRKYMLEHVTAVLRRELSEHEMKKILQATDYYGASLVAVATVSGNRDTFKTVLDVTTDYLIEDKVKDMLVSKDNNGASLLALAIASGSGDAFDTVLDVLTNELTEHEVGNMLAFSHIPGRSLLAEAARSKNEGLFKAVLAAVRARLPKEKVDTVISSRDNGGRSLISWAVGSGNAEIFKSAITAVFDELNENEIKSMLTADKRSLLAVAARGGNTNLFEALLDAARVVLPPNQLKNIISWRDECGRSLLHSAVASKSAGVFRAAMVAVSDELAEEEVGRMLRTKDCLLSMAASSGNNELWQAVLSTVKAELPREQVKRAISSRDSVGHSLLSSATQSGSAEMFSTVMTAVSGELSEEEMRDVLRVKGYGKGSLLADAAYSGQKELLEAVVATFWSKLPREQIKTMISFRDKDGRSFLFAAVESKSAQVFKAAMAAVSTELTEKEVNDMLRAKDYSGRTLLMEAARSGMEDLWGIVLAYIRSKLPAEKVKLTINSLDKDGNSLFTYAVYSMNDEVFRMAITACSAELSSQKMRELLCKKGRYLFDDSSDLMTPLDVAIRYGKLGLCDIALRSVQKYLGDKKVEETLDSSFLQWADRYKWARQGMDAGEIVICKKIFTMLFKHLARPPKEFFQALAGFVRNDEEQGWQRFTDLVLGVMVSAKNPLIPGMNISVALAEAAEGAHEGWQKRLSSLQKRVDRYMLEMLELLPQTVRGFEGGMSQCSALFEPEEPWTDLRGRRGPLRVAFERQHQTEILCAVPLFMDYLSRTFTHGLPDMQDSDKVLQDWDELRRLAKEEGGDGFVLGVTPGDDLFEFNRYDFGDSFDTGFLRLWLQGANASRPSLTILPGAQFIIAGVLDKPNSYYRVPAMRMALDYVVHAVMLAAYSIWVLLYEDGPLTIGEIIFACYLVVGVFLEAEAISKDPALYFRGRWNVLDVLAFVTILGGFLARIVDSHGPWGRALYALSAPPMFTRILTLAQILPFQGPMIKVIFSMAMIVLQFGVVLLVVMVGFAMSLYTLLRGDNDFTFDATLLLLFKTLLGDVDAFDEFNKDTGNRYAPIGRLLLVLYLVVMTIMLLNLLIAVLTTAYAKVEIKADREFKVSKAKVIDPYRLVVAMDLLPAPLNLVQFAVTLPFILKGRSGKKTEGYRQINQEVGQFLFWLASGPLAVAVGTLIWVASSVVSFSVPARDLVRSIPPLSLVRVSLRTREPLRWIILGLYSLFFSAKEPSHSALPPGIVKGLCLHIGVFIFCALGAPLCLLFLWLRELCLRVLLVLIAPVTTCFARGKRRSEMTTPQPSRRDNTGANVHRILGLAGAGGSNVLKYLEDPISNPEVRPDEVERGTTVEHVKLLRNRLENRFNDRVDRLEKKVNERVDYLEARTNDLFAHVSETNRRTEENVSLILEILQGGQGSVGRRGKLSVG